LGLDGKYTKKIIEGAVSDSKKPLFRCRCFRDRKNASELNGKRKRILLK